MPALAVFRFELGYQLRRAWPWLIGLALFVLAFLVARENALAEALYDEFYVNSPFSIAKTTVVGSLFWLLMAAAISGEAAARDWATGMAPLMFTTPISKAAYWGGRFAAAFTLQAALLALVPVAILVAVYLAPTDPVVVGPFRAEAYLTAYFYIALPTALIATVLQFTIASSSGRPMSAYVGSVLVMLVTIIIAGALLYRSELGEVLDIIGMRFILSTLSHEWTSIEKSERLLRFEGVLMWNRLLWIGVSLLIAGLAFWRFRFEHRVAGGWRWLAWRRRSAEAPDSGLQSLTTMQAVQVPDASRQFGFTAALRQTLAIARISFGYLLRSWPAAGLLLFIPAVTVLIVADQLSAFGVPILPTTGQVLRHLTAPITAELSPWAVVSLFTVYFVGELVWRDREERLAEVSDTLPISEWLPFLGQLLAVAGILALFITMQIVAGVIAQTAMAYGSYDLPLYATVMYGLQLPEYLLFAVLVFFVHTVVQQKYVGYLAALLLYVLILLGPTFGVQHPMLLFGTGARWIYGEMRGFAGSLIPWAAFKAYWAAWALLLMVATRLLWLRGSESAAPLRIRLARTRFLGGTKVVAVIAILFVAGTGAVLGYNLHLLNSYETPKLLETRKAEYERRYRRYADVQQPAPDVVALNIDIFPEQGRASIDGRYVLENRGDSPIDTLLVSVAPGWPPARLEIGREVALVVNDSVLGQRVYAFAQPLRPGETTTLEFHLKYEPRGFRAGGADAAIIANGSVVPSAWMPGIGYRRDRELLTPSARRRNGLPERPVIPSLYDERERDARLGGGFRFEAVVSTGSDQRVAAPGALTREWTEGERRFFAFATDAPIGGEWSILSARYGEHRTQWTDPRGVAKPVSIRVLYHPAHEAQVAKIVSGAKASLDYLTQEFGPYGYGHLTVAETPGTGLGMHADASLLTYAEGYALFRPRDASRGLDMPFAVMTHEMSHQWNVPAAFVEGTPILSEGMAWYYGMRVVEDALGSEQRERLLRFMRQPYPYAPINRGEPLLRGLDPYMSYRKAPFAMHALERYVGAEPVAQALRALQDRHRRSGAPLATTLDLYRELQAVTPDSMQSLLHDLFEVNTNWSFEIRRARASQVDAEHWDVTLEIRARKQVSDSAGVVTELPLTDLVELAVFAPNPGGWELGTPLYRALHRLESGTQDVTIRVRGKPAMAGADPFHVLDWEEKEDDDNIVEVRLPDPQSEP